jgi:predicted permease
MLELLDDLRSSLRVLRRRPVFALMAVTILALGLSSSVAVYTYVRAFAQPFPGVDHRGLTRLFGVDDENPYLDISYLDYLDYAAATGDAFDEIGAVAPYYAASVRRERMTEVAFLSAVSGRYFSVLGIETVVGRGLQPDDDDPSATPVAVLSHSWWQRSFGGDPSVIGTTLYLNFRPFVVVGVATPEFLGGASDSRPEVWIPMAPFADRYTNWARRAENRDIPLVRVYARLRDGVSKEQGLSALRTVASGLNETYPPPDGPRQLRLDPATWIDPRVRLAENPTVRLMMGAAAGLLVLVCANVANLLLAVATGRRREIALRAAIGASPGRIARQILAENVLLSTLAGGVAMVLAGPAAARLGSYFARPSVWGANVSREVAVDWHVLVFALIACVATGLVAGLLPALGASRQDLVNTLKTDATLDATGPRRLVGRRLPAAPELLVSTQVGLAVVLLVVAGLVVRTLTTVTNRDPGFAHEQMVAAQISTSSTEVAASDRENFLREMAAALSREPWIRGAGVSGYALLAGHPSLNLRVDDRDDTVPLLFSTVVPDFFESVGVDVTQGRSFVEGDSAGSGQVAMVNEALVRRFFEGKTPVGRSLWLPAGDGTQQRFEIVGVSHDVMARNFMIEPEPLVYFPYAQRTSGTSNALMITTAIDPAAAVPLLYRWLRDYEPYLAIINVLPYSDVISGFVYTQRMNAELFSLLAVFGLTLAAVGIFGVMSLTVSQRTHEVGIRMAIGARSGEIGRMVIGQAMIPVALGLALGLIASYALAGVVRSLLFGVEPGDPLALIGGTALLVAAALAAAYLPSRRAAAVDPAKALRAT